MNRQKNNKHAQTEQQQEHHIIIGPPFHMSTCTRFKHMHVQDSQMYRGEKHEQQQQQKGQQ